MFEQFFEMVLCVIEMCERPSLDSVIDLLHSTLALLEHVFEDGFLLLEDGTDRLDLLEQKSNVFLDAGTGFALGSCDLGPVSKIYHSMST